MICDISKEKRNKTEKPFSLQDDEKSDMTDRNESTDNSF